MPELKISIEIADVADAEEILNLQKIAYLSEAEIYNDYTIPPLLHSLDGMKLDFKDYLFLKAVVDGRIVGSVRAKMNEGTCLIGRLIVHPDFQSRGIGTTLLREIEGRFKGAERFELFTGYKSERNLHIYGKAGYRVFKSEPLSAHIKMLYLEKPAREN